MRLKGLVKPGAAFAGHSLGEFSALLMAENPNFHVLVLTVTPGRTPEAVQAIVDALHISRIEIRDEQSLDIRPSSQ